MNSFTGQEKKSVFGGEVGPGKPKVVVALGGEGGRGRRVGRGGGLVRLVGGGLGDEARSGQLSSSDPSRH